MPIKLLMKKDKLISGGLLFLILLLVLTGALLTFFSGFNEYRKIIRENNLLSVPVSPIPSLAIPSPTPTLTQQQILLITKANDERNNQKYGPCKRVPVLMYHYTLPEKEAKQIKVEKLNVPVDVFRLQMDYLVQKDYQTISINEMLEGIRNDSLPPKPVVLTFDDGYRSFYSYAYPILKDKNLKATLFVISQYVDGERYVTWDQIKEMANSGIITIGDHTLNHPVLPKLTKEEEFNQIVSAKKVIEENAGTSVTVFAYPYGNANDNARQILAENGFAGAVLASNISSQCVGRPYDLSRIRIGAAQLSAYGIR